MDIFQNTFFKEGNNMLIEKNLRATTNIYKKECLPVIKWNQKHSSKQVVQMPYTVEKKFLVAATFEALWDFYFETE